MNIVIKEVKELPQAIVELEQEANKEELALVTRMIEEFKSGKNRFDGPGEFFLTAYDNDKLIACGGLSQQWNENDVEARIGRVRRFYVLPEYRKHGVGKHLLKYLENKAVVNFSALCLYTDTHPAAHFYQKMNYVFVENHPNYNYFKYLISTHE
jgi:GNAT superfamily N-acetyltransferase